MSSHNKTLFKKAVLCHCTNKRKSNDFNRKIGIVCTFQFVNILKVTLERKKRHKYIVLKKKDVDVKTFSNSK